MNKIKCFLSLLLAVLFLPILPASAVGSIDASAELTLTISYVDDKTPIAGAKFSAYMIAEANGYGELTVTDEFKKYGIEGSANNDASWSTLASTLESYVLRDSIAPLAEGKTDDNGKLTFPADKAFAPGLYLVAGQRHEQNGNYYEPSPFIVMLPSYDAQGDRWMYNITANVKYESTPTDGGTVNRKVIKVWNDKGNEAGRPKEITVKLLRDAQVYDTVVLSSENNWRYEWTALDSAYTWRVCEKVPQGYTMSVTQEGTAFIITNTAENDDTPPKPEEPKLPQTGQLWWPVPVLAASGLLLLLCGLLIKKRDQNE